MWRVHSWDVERKRSVASSLQIRPWEMSTSVYWSASLVLWHALGYLGFQGRLKYVRLPKPRHLLII
ncbi:hypothetical protein BDV34DRAFT_111730 [Aspergillus parasiticus]|uniref:Uncharacterized protein n=1 Tax=Aspergillus parasiticus TaxID=5067 RepID=A0A5N6DI90_ASPPA|nr:hypothetical protein BDV34DRAFT_111730 [Aspergillus parasiticus]